MKCTESESTVALPPGLPVLVGTPTVANGITIRPELRAVDVEGWISSPETVNGGWRFLVPGPGRYRLTWGVARKRNGVVEKGALDQKEPRILTVKEQAGEQWFESGVSPSDLARPLR